MWTWSRNGSCEEEGRQGGTPRGDSGSRKNVLDKEGNKDEARVDCSLIVVLQEAVKEKGKSFLELNTNAREQNPNNPNRGETRRFRIQPRIKRSQENIDLLERTYSPQVKHQTK